MRDFRELDQPHFFFIHSAAPIVERRQSVKHPWPYTRDPAAYFKTTDPRFQYVLLLRCQFWNTRSLSFIGLVLAGSEKKLYPAPMNSNGKDHTGIQPIKYSKASFILSGSVVIWRAPIILISLKVGFLSRQIVLEQIMLVQAIGDFAPNTTFEYASVHWLTGQVATVTIELHNICKWSEVAYVLCRYSSSTQRMRCFKDRKHSTAWWGET